MEKLVLAICLYLILYGCGFQPSEVIDQKNVLMTNPEASTRIKGMISNSLVLKAIVTNPTIRKAESGPFHVLSLPVHFTLSNDGSDPIIVIKKSIKIVEIRLAKTGEALNTKDFWFETSGLPSFKDEELLKLQDLKPDVVDVIAPGGFHEWESVGEVFVVEKDDHSYSRPYLSLEDLNNLESLWVVFYVSFFPTNTMAAEGEQLQKRWQFEGQLLLETLKTNSLQIKVLAKS